MNDKRPSAARKWLFRAAQAAIVLIVVWAVQNTLVDAWSQIRSQMAGGEWSVAGLLARLAVDAVLYPFGHPSALLMTAARVVGWTTLAGVLYLAAMLPAAVYWHRVLHQLGQKVRWSDTLRAYYIGHLGKYAPGKAWVVLIRVGLIGGEGVNKSVVAASVFLETFAMMSVGAFLAAAYVVVYHRHETLLVGTALVVMVGSGLPTLPPIFSRIARLLGVARSDPVAAEKVRTLPFRTLIEGWGAMFVLWLLLGLSLWATLRAIGIERADAVGELPRYTATSAMALVAGFASFLTPGGLGVREFVMAVLLVPYLKTIEVGQPEAVAFVAAALMRIASVVAELAISGILYLWGLWERRRVAS